MCVEGKRFSQLNEKLSRPSLADIPDNAEIRFNDSDIRRFIHFEFSKPCRCVDISEDIRNSRRAFYEKERD